MSMENLSVQETAAAFAAALAATSPKIDTAEIERIAGEVATRKVQALAGALLPKIQELTKIAMAGSVCRVEVQATETRPAVNLGLQHYNFELLFRLCQARDLSGFVPPLYLYGPAGTGKTTAAQSIAKALGLEFYFNGSIDSEYKLSGFVDAGGVFRSRPFFEAYKNGGVYLFDELDSSLPGAVLAFNSALANGFADFPCGRVARHKDCIILAAGNSCMRGDGGEAGYDRIRQDSSFRDRFAFLAWGIDDGLEAAMVGAAAPSDWVAPVVELGGPVEWTPERAAAWLRIVRGCRRNAAAGGIMDFEITPRATKTGCAYLCSGVSGSAVVDLVLRKGLPEAEWRQVSRGVDFEVS